MKLLVSVIAALAAALAIVSVRPIYAQSPSPSESMASANDLYNSERYEEAARSYERLVGLGYEGADLFYNLASAYYQQDDLGRAILNFLRAQRLAPSDEDIQANLKLVREQTEDEFEPVEFGGPLASFATSIPLMSTNIAAALVLVLWAIIAGSIALWLLRTGRRARNVARIIGGGAGVLMILAAILLAGSLQADSAYDNATVIVADEVQVLSGPGAQYAEEFTLHSGAETELMGVRGNWSRISVPATGLEGWVPRSAVEPVVPRANS